MRLKKRIGIVLSIVLFVVAALYWQGRHQHRADSAGTESAAAPPRPTIPLVITNAPVTAVTAQTPGGTTNAPFVVIMTNSPFAAVTNRLAYRLSNSSLPLGEL